LMKSAMAMASKLKIPLAMDFRHGVVIASFETKAIVKRVKVGFRGGVHELS